MKEVSKMPYIRGRIHRQLKLTEGIDDINNTPYAPTQELPKYTELAQNSGTQTNELSIRATTVSVPDAAAFIAALGPTGPAGDLDIVLTGTIDLTSPVTISVTHPNVTIRSQNPADWTINNAGILDTAYLITVPTGVSLTIIDTVVNGAGRDAAALLYVLSNGFMTLGEGAIVTGFRGATQDHMAIYVYNSTSTSNIHLTITGNATVYDNVVTSSGSVYASAIRTIRSNVVINDRARITDNHIVIVGGTGTVYGRGAGIYLNRSSLVLTDNASIDNNILSPAEIFLIKQYATIGCVPKIAV